MFCCGFLIGATCMFFVSFFYAVQVVNEKDREIKYIRQQLYFMAREQNDEY